MYKFSSLIKCSDCNSKYRGKKDRGVPLYICSGYHNKTSNCARYPLKEEELLYILDKHISIIEREKMTRSKWRDSPISYIRSVKVFTSEKGYVINYKDGTYSRIENNHIKY